MPMPSMGESLKIQADKSTQPVDVSPLPYQPPQIWNKGHMNLVASVARDGGYTWARQEGLRLIKANLATSASECPTCQQQRLVLENTNNLLGAELTIY